ncbi:hypothetical protein HYH03_018437 [Edaphochlamys debaryana]|uniref:histone acetyltransferase n=1 Tax=Edaphochlamys debaryana TaxID=47281 RepID=A0A835XLY1_9CHLO|nr:hypothetical protein HYH03_018437 [Edaphochlamys debaryana]|eukprot:KAG2482629.1 hypothetical protein HYH03_018437 [Edaphochlamys debaryana]
MLASAPNQMAAPPPFQPWQSEADAADRKMMTEHIYQIFQSKRPAQQQYNSKLPEFVKRLEEGLYRSANSKAEYTDMKTLEQRLHDVAKRFVKPPGQPAQPAGAPGGVLQAPPMPQNGLQQPVQPSQMPNMVNMGLQGMGQQFQLPQPQPMQPQGLMPNNGGMPGSMGLPDPLRNQMPQVGGHGMIPTQPMQQLDPGNQYPQLLGTNNPGFNPGASMPQGVMSNGAPVLIRGQRDWNGNPSQQLLGGQPGPQGMNKLTINGLPPGQLTTGPGMIPQQQPMLQSGFVPSAPGPAPGGMIPMGNGPVGNGMVPMGNPTMPMATTGSPMLNGMNNFAGGPPNGGMGGMGQPLPGMVPVGGVNPNPAALPGMMPMPTNNPGGFPGGPGGMQLGQAPNMGQVPMPNANAMLGDGGAPGQGLNGGGGPGGFPNINLGGGGGGMAPDERDPKVQEQYVQKQQRWLLFLRHCAKCRAPGEECQLKSQCKFGKQLWQHILQCQNGQCEYPRCTSSKELLKHHQKCQLANCPVCAPVKDYVKKTRQATQQQNQQQAQQQVPQLQPQLQPQQPFGMPGPGGMPGQPPMMPNGMMPQQQQPQQQAMRLNTNGLGGQKRPHEMMGGGMVGGMDPGMPGMVPVGPGPGGMGMPGPMGMGAPMQPAPLQPVAPGPGPGQGPGLMPGQPGPKRAKTEDVLRQNTGTSLLETFDAKQIRVHVDLIRAAAVTQKAQQQPPANPEDACKVCMLTKLSFEPPVIYCTSCGLKIKRGQIFYSTPPEHGNDLKGYFCHQCFTDQKGERITIEGVSIKKSDLVKRKNDEEIEEGWVQCDHCEGWVHQICGMFNKGRNNNDVHYLCPECLAFGYDHGHRQKTEIRPQAMLEAKDLPTSRLSEWITERLNRELEKERLRRAEQHGKQPHEVQGPEPLTVRMINSVIKKCEVKPKFHETFQAEAYASEFPYRQKVLLLFQSLDGVDVCLFCMYVQEYGRDCMAPNTNVVYLSYLDSVKYFRPEIPSALGPAVSLRTFVYHELLIGYIEFVKNMGFEQMYIWACPPMQGDDYILYCHPTKQKTPRSDRLRMWYIEMLKMAKEEGIVVHLSTLWDTYFEGGRDHRMERCSATFIPYMEGDYWPGEAENQLVNITDAARGGQKKGAGGVPSRKAGSKGKRYGGGPATTDEQLMSRLGEILGGNMREDFIVVHMQWNCQFCRTHIRGPNLVYRYRLPPGATPPKAAPERKFEGIKLEGGGPSIPAGTVTSLTICEACFKDEETRLLTGQMPRLPAGVTPADLLCEKLEPQVMWQSDPDGDMESEFFDTRQTFLSLCQGNHYQFDTLRRAKHSSMMVLYHLHNPHSPAFASSCNVCQAEIEPGQGFRCTVCSDFDMCASCKVNVGHAHPVVPHKRALDETRQRLTEAERRERNEQLQKTLALLVHACSCQNQACGSNSCRKVKQLFQHAVHCQAKVTGGCQLCKKMWCLLNLHAKSCTRADCSVPRCKELKELRRRQTNRQEEKRRAAYAAMLRQQMAAQGPRGPM